MVKRMRVWVGEGPGKGEEKACMCVCVCVCVCVCLYPYLVRQHCLGAWLAANADVSLLVEGVVGDVHHTDEVPHLCATHTHAHTHTHTHTHSVSLAPHDATAPLPLRPPQREPTAASLYMRV